MDPGEYPLISIQLSQNCRKLRIPAKPITRSGLKPITYSGQADHQSERSDAGVRLCL
jgi:hypothetical protein